MDDIKIVMLARAAEWQNKLDKYTDEQLNIVFQLTARSRKELSRKLDKATITEWNNKRTLALLDEVQVIQQAIRNEITKRIADTSATAGHIAYEAHGKILSFNGDASAVILEGIALTAGQMKSIIVDTPIGGNILREWVDKVFSSNMRDKIKKEISAGLINGESYKAITNRLKDSWQATERELETLTRTYVASANSKAMQDVYDANKDVVKKVEWRAGMSNKTCLRCSGLDGNEYPVSSHPPLPLHPRCRCTLLPVVDLKALGITDNQLKEHARPYSIREGHIVGKGKIVSAGTWNGDYESFISAMTKRQKLDLLGPNRLRMLESGEVKFSQLVDKKDGRIKTLKELAQ